MSHPRLLAAVVGLALVAALAFFFISTSPADRDTLATSGLIAVVKGGQLRVLDGEGKNAGAVEAVAVDGYVAWSTDASSLGFGRGDTLYWAPTNLQFSRKIGTIVPGSRFFWSPDGKEVLVQTAGGAAIVDKADKRIWSIDGVRPLGWWVASGLVGSGIVVTDGKTTRIVSTYNNETLWTFTAPAAVPSPAGPAVLLQRPDGWSIWEPPAGERPLPGVAPSATAAWGPGGGQVAIEAAGSAVLVNVSDLKVARLGNAGDVAGWVGEQVAVVDAGRMRLVDVRTGQRKDFPSVTSASLQPAAPRADQVARPGPVRFTPVLQIPKDGMAAAVVPHPNGEILYTVDLTGRIFADRGGIQRTVLDIRDRVTAWDESGLLDMALHPRFAENHLAYVYYGTGGVTDRGGLGQRLNVIASFELARDGMSAVPGSFRVRHTMTTPQETPMSHNGGTLAFAPDGRLYLGVGDLGAHELAGDPKSLTGAFLSFDADQPGEWRPESLAYGFRNPFRFAVDPVTAQVWIGDVGGNQREEIDILTRGGNFGWPLREGEICRATLTDCDTPGVPPVYAWWPYEGGAACAGVIGGFVYRGNAMPGLRGWYLYSDLCGGEIRAIDPAAAVPQAVTLGRAPGAPTWGAVVDLTPDAAGEPLAVGLTGGVWRLTPGD